MSGSVKPAPVQGRKLAGQLGISTAADVFAYLLMVQISGKKCGANS